MLKKTKQNKRKMIALNVIKHFKKIIQPGEAFEIEEEFVESLIKSNSAKLLEDKGSAVND